jgi:flagellar hook-associated protein 2
MAGISIGGIATGLPPNLVDQLIEAEKMPIKTIQASKGKQEGKLKLVTDLETKLNAITSSIGGLASAHGFTDMKLTSGDNNVVGGTVDPSAAVSGSWNVQVEELAQKAAAITNGFPDKNKTQVGVGYFKFETKDGTKSVYVNGSSNTLEGVASQINNAQAGVKASVINDRSDPDAPYRLMISGNGVGDDNMISYPTLYFLDGDQDMYFDKKQEAKNGRVKIDGFEFQVNDNKVQDVIPGVTLELHQENPGKTVNVSIKEDKEVVTGKVKGFVDSVNAVLAFIQQQNALNKESDTSATLGGDGLLRSIEMRLRALVQNPQYGTGNVNRLAQLGIQFQRNGTLEYKEDAFTKALATDPSGVHKFLAGDGFATGFVPTLRREISNLLNQAYGPVATRKRSLQDKIKQMDDQIGQKEKQLAVKEEGLKRKFAALEETVSRLKGQGGVVASIGAGAPSGGGGLG